MAAGADMVMLDNMTPDEVAACVKLVDGRCLVEVSGRVTLETVGDYAAAGADLISVGALTHSAPVLDIGLDLQEGPDVLLAIDVGNTQTVVGLYGDGDLLDHWRIATNAERTSDEHALLFAQFLDKHGLQVRRRRHRHRRWRRRYPA